MKRGIAIAIMTLLAACGGVDTKNQSGDEKSQNAKSGEVVDAGFIVEGYPASVAKSIQDHEIALSKAAMTIPDATNQRRQGGNKPYSSVVINSFHRWKPGSTIKVAFLGGNPTLYEQIERVAGIWTAPGLANLTLSFRNEQGAFRLWTPNDKTYSGEIRVAFTDTGYWSLVGTDSITKQIEGGNPYEPSMNFAQFPAAIPHNWEIVVLHEFGHALGFEHEHQSPAVNCGFRFDDDPNYVPTRNVRGVFVADIAGRRPGLYTYLGGPPNKWNPSQIDFNLRTITESSGYPLSAFEISEYDAKSIMEYYFEPIMFSAGKNSPCYIARENAQLSAQDKIAASRAYKAGAAGLAASILQESEILAIENSKSASAELREAVRSRRKLVGKLN